MLSFFSNLIKKIKSTQSWGRISFIVLGTISTIWFLFRVVPKPQRAAYPCMRAAAPFMSSFVIYLLTLSGAALLLKRFPKGFKTAQVTLTVLFFVIALAIPGISHIKEQNELALAPQLEDANSPMGIAKGINPGRVVWVYNPDATDDNFNQVNSNGGVVKTGGYFMDKYTDQAEVDKMLDAAVKQISDENTIKASWDAIFKYHNKERGKGEVNYQKGEIIFLKINRTSSWGGNYNNSDLARVTTNNNYAISETSPQVVTAVLRHLVNIVGVDQQDIVVGDPMKHIYKDDYEKWHGEFPDVTYLDVDRSNLGRQRVVKSTTAVIDYSDRGEILREGDWGSALTGNPIQTDMLYTIFEEMEYMINLPTLKSHKHGGVTMFAKNHFGSHTRSDAKHLHGGLTKMGDDPIRNQYGMYRVLVDIMGHELLGKKNLIYIMDALYCADMEVTQPKKFQKAPWNNTWTSSLFISQDPVAIESVGFDFLYYEYDGTSKYESFPHYGAVDDYLHQVADKANWPEGIVYDPENDGTEIPSLGVHEHWNNPTDMQYSRNLGTGEGIELVKVYQNEPTSSPFTNLFDQSIDLNIFPNPVVNQATLRFNLKEYAHVSAELYSIDGRMVNTLISEDAQPGSFQIPFEASMLKSGIYYLRLNVENKNGVKFSTFKFEKR